MRRARRAVSRADARVVSVLVAIFVSFAVIGCGNGDQIPSPATTSPTAGETGTPTQRTVTSLDFPVRIAVTLPIFEDFVRRVGGDHVEVFSLVPEGQDPTTYTLTAADIELLKGVKFVYVNGLGLDDQILESVEANRDEDAYVIPFGPNVRSPSGGGVYADEAGDEPHLWLDPDLAAVYVAIVADEFVIYDGTNRAFYDDKFRASTDALTGLADELSVQLSHIPDGQRKLIASSEALAHVGRRFAFEIVGTVTGGGAGESDQDAVQRLVRLVEAEGVPAVFAEYGHDASLIEAVAEKTGAELCTLYTDIVDDDITNYEDMMRANVAGIVRCLGG